jgi:hypothetical protein
LAPVVRRSSAVESGARRALPSGATS